MAKSNENVPENGVNKEIDNINVEELNKFLKELEGRQIQLIEEQNGYITQDIMEKSNIYEKLNKNMQDLEVIENEISKMQLTVYKKVVENLKEAKLNEIKEFFDQQSRYYNQKSEKYKSEIDAQIEKYKEEIEKLVKAYDNLYINVFKIMKTANTNQKIAIANILAVLKGMKESDFSDIDKQTAQNVIATCIQKKDDYANVVKECKAKITWCVENVQKDINETFVNNMNQMQIYKENIVSKIVRMMFNAMSGKSKYKKFLENYETDYLLGIKVKNESKISYVVSTLKGIVSQMEETRKQICKSI